MRERRRESWWLHVRLSSCVLAQSSVNLLVPLCIVVVDMGGWVGGQRRLTIVHPSITDTPRSEQPSTKWTDCLPLPIYYCPYIFIYYYKGTTSLNNMLVPNVSIIRRFHCIKKYLRLIFTKRGLMKGGKQSVCSSNSKREEGLINPPCACKLQALTSASAQSTVE